MTTNLVPENGSWSVEVINKAESDETIKILTTRPIKSISADNKYGSNFKAVLKIKLPFKGLRIKISDETKNSGIIINGIECDDSKLHFSCDLIDCSISNEFLIETPWAVNNIIIHYTTKDKKFKIFDGVYEGFNLLSPGSKTTHMYDAYTIIKQFRLK